MDTITHYVYSPAEPNYYFTLDLNGDGKRGTMPQYPEVPFNHSCPTIHSSGANVALLDGQVERVSFSELWEVNNASRVVHSFWHLED